MDTDNLYFALSARKLEDVVKPELRDEFDNCKKEWLATAPQACSSSSLMGIAM